MKKTEPEPETERVKQYDALCSTDDVARELGISREGARLIEMRALEKLRKGLAIRGYRASDFFDVEEKV